jgi:hypothetical protein
MNALQALVINALIEAGTNGKPMSPREASNRSGNAVSYEIIRQLKAGEHSGRLHDTTVEGLSKALGVTENQIRRAAGMPKRMPPWEWPRRFDRLTLHQRKLVEQLAQALLDAREVPVEE